MAISPHAEGIAGRGYRKPPGKRKSSCAGREFPMVAFGSFSPFFPVGFRDADRDFL